MQKGKGELTLALALALALLVAADPAVLGMAFAQGSTCQLAERAKATSRARAGGFV
jgi:hypothetical protein